MLSMPSAFEREPLPDPSADEGEKIEHPKILTKEGVPVDALTQAARDELAQRVRDIRKERDAASAAANRPINKMLEVLGSKRGSRYFSREAAEHARRSKSELQSGKERIQRTEENIAGKAVAETVRRPLRELQAAASKEEVAEILQRLSVSNLDAALQSEQHQDTLLGDLADYFTFRASPDAAGHKAIVKLAKDIVATDLRNGSKLVQEKFITLGPVLNAVLEYLKSEEKQHLAAAIEQASGNTQANGDVLRDCVVRTPKLGDLVMKFGSPEAKEQLKRIVAEEVASGNLKLLEAEGINELYWAARMEFERYIKDHFGLDPESLFEAWNWKAAELEANLRTMNQVEAGQAGAVRILHDTFGIKEFLRYPPELLVAQAKEVGVNQPYGVIIFPRHDAEGSFDDITGALKKLFEDTRGHHGLRVFEVAGKYGKNSLAKALLSLDKRYGESNKISFMVLGGHGLPGSVTLGFRKALEQHKLEGAARRNVKGLFEENPSIMLFACSTGHEQGIARELSRILEGTAMGPETTALASSIEVKTNYNPDGKAKFDVHYNVPTKRYFKGQLQEELSEQAA